MKFEMEKHESFISGAIIPAAVEHSTNLEISFDETLVAVIVAMAIMLRTRGYDDAALMGAINASRFTEHEAPRGLQ